MAAAISARCRSPPESSPERWCTRVAGSGMPTAVEQLEHPRAPLGRARSRVCSRRASPISRPMGRSGSSETRASCGTSPTPAPRSRRHSRSPRPRAGRVPPSSRRSAAHVGVRARRGRAGPRGDTTCRSRTRRRARRTRPARCGRSETPSTTRATPSKATRRSSTRSRARRRRRRDPARAARASASARPSTVVAAAVEHDHEAGEERHPPGRRDVGAAGREHRAPLRRRRHSAEAEVAERRRPRRSPGRRRASRARRRARGRSAGRAARAGCRGERPSTTRGLDDSRATDAARPGRG